MNTDEHLTRRTLFCTLEASTGLIVKSVYLSESGKPSDNWTAAELIHPVSLACNDFPYLLSDPIFENDFDPKHLILLSQVNSAAKWKHAKIIW